VDFNVDMHVLGYFASGRLSLHIPTCIIRILFLDIPGPSSSNGHLIAAALYLHVLNFSALFSLFSMRKQWPGIVIFIVILCIPVPPIPSQFGAKYTT